MVGGVVGGHTFAEITRLQHESFNNSVKYDPLVMKRLSCGLSFTFLTYINTTIFEETDAAAEQHESHVENPYEHRQK